MLCRKCSSTSWPCSVCSTSGCHCTPASRRVDVLERGHRRASVEAASTVKPSGAATTESPWLIHTRCCSRHLGEQGARRGDGDRGAAVLRAPGPAYLAAERLRHRLEAVAHAEHRDPGLEHARSTVRGARLVDRRRAAGQDDRLRVPRQHLLDRHRVRDDLGVDPRLADPAGDELGVLRAEVDDEDQVVFGGQPGAFRRGDLGGPPAYRRSGSLSRPKFLAPRPRNPGPGPVVRKVRDPVALLPPRPGLSYVLVRSCVDCLRARPSLPPRSGPESCSRGARPGRSGTRARSGRRPDDRQPQRRGGRGRAPPGAAARPARAARTPSPSAGRGSASPLFGQNAIARSACAVIVSEGFTPRFAEIAEPSAMCSPG